MSSHLVQVPTFDIEGRKYTFERLKIRTIQQIISMIKSAWKDGVIDLNIHLEQMKFLSGDAEFNPEVTPELLLFFSAEHCLDPFLELTASALVEVLEDGTRKKIKLEELEDAEQFPMYSLVTIGAFFTAHPDISMFVSAINEGKDLPFFQSVIQKAKNLKKQA